MRLGLFGGSFDPVHYGHLLLAECCREQGRLDRVCFLPAAVPPHKQNRELTAAETRIAMLQLAIAGQPAFCVSPYEADRGGVNYTVDTLAHFRRQEPNGQLFFLLGADSLRELPGWRDPDRICELATIVVVRRPGAGAVDLDVLKPVISAAQIERLRRHQVEMPQIGISSTEIRRRVPLGQSIRYRTPWAVEEYIAAHGLYR